MQLSLNDTKIKQQKQNLQNQRLELLKQNRDRMKVLCNPTYDRPHSKWIQRFLEKNSYYITNGINAFKGLLIDGTVKVSLLDFTMNQEQSAIVEKTINEETELPYFTVRQFGDESMIEQIFPLGEDILAVKLTVSNQIYLFAKDTSSQEETEHDKQIRELEEKKSQDLIKIDLSNPQLSSTYHERYSAEKAIDGDMSESSFCHAKFARVGEYWSADFTDGMFNIEKVVILNR